MFPPNIIQATVFQYKTELKLKEDQEEFFPNGTKGDIKKINHIWIKKLIFFCKIYIVPLEEYHIAHKWTEGTNVLGLVMFSVIMGAVIGKMKEKGKPLQDLFQVLSDAMMQITSWVIWLSPIGIFFLIAEKMLEIESFSNVFITLGWYFVTVMLGLMLHGFGEDCYYLYI